jgi:colanic acid biosynthesis glycosyl transferase WcaI
MKIVLYSANFAPEPTGVGKYSGEMAAWLAARGHSVRVVAAPPYYPHWRVDGAYRRPWYRIEQWQGVEVWRAPIWVPRHPHGLNRILHLLSFACSSFPLILRQLFWRPDLIITVAPAFMCAPAGLLIARLCGARSWLHVQDFEVNIAFRMGLLEGKTLQRLILRMERWILRRFDSVSTISSRMVEQLVEKGVEVDRIRYMPNWVDIAHIKPALARGVYRAELNIAPDAVVVLSSGTLGGKQGLMSIPKVARYLSHRRDIVFVICGNGVLKKNLEAAAQGLQNLLFLPLQPVAQLGELLCMANIHLLTQSPGAADLVLPSKLSGMLASARPVVATCHPGTELEGIVSRCGMVAEPDNIPELADAICKLADDAPLRQELGRRGRAFAEKIFERDAVLGGVFGPMEQINSVPDDVTV